MAVRGVIISASEKIRFLGIAKSTNLRTQFYIFGCTDGRQIFKRKKGFASISIGLIYHRLISISIS
jgi:putative aminopeptidase FrvX